MTQVFEKSGVPFASSETFNFGEHCVRRVSADIGHSSDYVRSVKIFAEGDEKVFELSTNSKMPPSNMNEISHIIAENEEIIGVYGICGSKNSFNNLGFILKVYDKAA